MSFNEDLTPLPFDLPKNQSNVIKVVGVGGGGSNAIKHMYQQGIKGVDFVICNTDSQALENSPVPNKIQLGVTLTEGLGAGANPEVGEQAAKESIEDVRRMLDTNTKMVFITAGMGGGTGTGAAPIIAEVARDLNILTVGIVTTPFAFEGKVRNEQAQAGIEKFRKHVDSLIIINNNKLREVYGNLGFKAGFSKADEVLATASRGIAEVITHHYTQNIDLRDAKTVLSNSGTAIMGSATCSGASRAQEGIMKALDSPLLNDNKITGAKNVLLLIVSGTEEITIDEIGEINDLIQQEAGGSANIIMGVGEDESLGDAISVTVIATGFNVEQQNEISNTEAKRIIHTLEDDQAATAILEEKESVTPGRLIIDETPEDDDVVSDAFAKAEPNNAIPVSEEPIKIVHTLGDEEPEPQLPTTQRSEHDLIPTTEIIKNIEVVYEEVLDHKVVEEELEIVQIQQELPAQLVEEPETPAEDQFLLDFDMPLSSQTIEEEPAITNAISSEEVAVEHAQPEQPVVHNLEDIEINDPVTLIPVTAVDEHGVTRYSLDDYMEVEEQLTQASPATDMVHAPEANEEEIQLITKNQVEPAPEVELEDSVEGLDPTEFPINEVLKRNAEERKRKMHAFNYKFKSSHRLEEIEKKPAFERQGIELDELPSDSDKSRTTLSIGEDDEIQLRSNNNSFLHDNVD
jgi:cell division protein FtsZ